MKYVISSCLLGIKCRWDGEDKHNEKLKSLLFNGSAMPICPEILGGMNTPREPAEIQAGDIKSVIDRTGTDVTDEFNLGAKSALAIAKIFGAECAILKSCSPSCGCREIYDGTFSGVTIKGEGITAELFRHNGIKVFNEKEWDEESD